MDTYSILREFADSWMLLILTLVFTGVIFWAFRPGSRSIHNEVAASIFRNDDKPATDPADRPNEARK
ncbi:CcoQ/FixQ family Cbb3-type cytochrome c oxidase assembly chaperone [Pseudorhodobacter aquimaris]|uniref:CcoQ/FixQ family Cbb3-type cytochrome c oxidase assembly chaperone n=1 Tax=Pseudorhodobacter aquimaris TaxID=687412 RepID=UPI00067E0C5F|nr:CcoQ/FixQ family Cbb3-type cytochrome c oxidase assembly chaperone [Pseudorhodobacter aquimaris]